MTDCKLQSVFRSDWYRTGKYQSFFLLGLVQDCEAPVIFFARTGTGLVSAVFFLRGLVPDWYRHRTGGRSGWYGLVLGWGHGVIGLVATRAADRAGHGAGGHMGPAGLRCAQERRRLLASTA